MQKEIYLTKQGLQSVQAELDYLIKVRRPEIVQELKDSHCTGNLLKSIEYSYARNEQAMNEKKINDLEVLKKRAIIITDINGDEVSIGTKVKLRFLEENETETYTIVGTYEANPLEYKISNESPIVKAILGKKINDIVTVTCKNDVYQVKILEIKF